MLKIEFLDYIRQGIRYRVELKYGEFKFTIRPLSSIEMDGAERAALKTINSEQMFSFIVALKNGNIKMEQITKTSPKMIKALFDYYHEINYWVCFYAMKDFQPSTFTIDDVKRMQFVHETAEQVLRMSSPNKEIIVEIIRTQAGRELGRCVYEWHVPLEDAVWKLTDLQKKNDSQRLYRACVYIYNIK